MNVRKCDLILICSMYIRYDTANACISRVFEVILRSPTCTLIRDVYLVKAFHFSSKPYMSERDVRFFSLGGTVRDRNSGNYGFLDVINFTYCKVVYVYANYVTSPIASSFPVTNSINTHKLSTLNERHNLSK